MSIKLISSGGDPQVGNLCTPLNGSTLTKTFINALPAYREGLSANTRGLEIGMAHGYLLYGPFAVLGPLRLTEYGPTAGLLATLGMISILTVCLSIYASAGVTKPTPNFTTPHIPESWTTKAGWSEFTGSFFIGACGGAAFAYFLCQTAHLQPLVEVASKIWSV